MSASPTASLDLVVDRSDLRRTALVPGRHSEETALGANEVLVRVDRFALTANNVTYGAVGDMIGYWKFFPADGAWGRIPVWGFGDVVRSRHDGLAGGERIYGYFPMSTHVVLRADHVSPAGFVDASPHRAGLPPVYNAYTRVARDPAYDRRREAEIALFRPLFTTSFLLDDFLAENGFFDASAVVLTSASSKTALGLAFLLAGKARVVGLTSASNASFVGRTGYYADVRGYDAVDGLPSDVATVLVDFAGNGGLLAAVHRRLGASLRYSCRVGVTHWEKMASPETLPGPEPVFFFAPDQARKRIEEWGAPRFQSRVAEAMTRFLGSTAAWLRVVEGRGPEAVVAAYAATVEGRTDPAEGRVLSL
ncbi:MAG TPA: DUF2855 family protein [Candidatus Binatia bacterium]|nr:DUF2855 family protein [Candidatus Binatia bacterium]